MSALTRLALDLLQSPTAPPGLRAVACSTLLCAMEHAIEVPKESHMAVWLYLLGSDASAVTMHGRQLDHPEVARDALRVLGDPEVGEAAQDLALATLRGGNVAEVQERDLLFLADRVLNDGRVRRIVWLVEQVHEVRGLAPELLRMLRNRLASSNDAAVRAGAVTVSSLLPELDDEFFGNMLNDPSPVVRAAVADNLEWRQWRRQGEERPSCCSETSLRARRTGPCLPLCISLSEHSFGLAGSTCGTGTSRAVATERATRYFFSRLSWV